MGSARIRGYGGAVPGGWTFAHTLYRAVWPPGSLTEPNKNFALSFCLTQKNMVEDYGFAPLSQAPLDIYKMAAFTHTNCRNLFKVMLIVTILGVPTGLATMLWLGYTYGFNVLPMAVTYSYPWMDVSVEYFNTIPSVEPIWPFVGVGFLLTGALSFLHFRFPWWPLEPIGLVLALNRPFQKAAFWMSFAEALIIKYLTLKIGGARAYEEYGVPFVSGFIGGFTLTVIAGMAVGVIRFFFPV
jgi:hypothetical protein